MVRCCMLGMLGVSLQLAAAPARAAVVRNEIINFDETFPDDCTGEDVALDVDLHLLLAQTTNANNNIIDAHTNFVSGHGVGLTSGIEYTVNEAFNETLHFSNNNVQSQTVVHAFHLISHGPAPNLVLKTLFHFVITPNGDLVVTIDDARAECLGPG